MREFHTSLEERLRCSRYNRERYQRDPEYRLRRLNAGRVHQGLKPRASVDEIGTVADGSRNRERDEQGRFV